MSSMFATILIVIIVVLGIENSKLRKIIRNNYKNQYKFCPNCGFNFITKLTENKVNEVKNNAPPIKEETLISTPIVKEKNDKLIKNSLILIVGAVLVILSAVIFLISTWQTSGNIIKLLVILFMFVIFSFASTIADTKLHLKDTSKAFFYISIAYIPLIFLSIYLFGLLGNYLSIYGDGNNIYLCISCLIVSAIYYTISKKKDLSLLSIFSLIFEVISITEFANIFDFNNFSNYLIIFNLYVLIFNLINNNYRRFFNEKIGKIFSNIITIGFSFITVCFNFSYLVIEPTINTMISTLLMSLNVGYLINKVDNKKSLFECFLPILLSYNFIIISLVLDHNNITLLQTNLLIGFIISSIYDIIKNGLIKNSTYITISSMFVLLYLFSLFAQKMDTYIIVLLLCIISLFKYLLDKSLYSSYITLSAMFILLIDLCNKFEISYYIASCISLITLYIAYFDNNIDKSLRKPFAIIGQTFYGILFLLSIGYANKSLGCACHICYLVINLCNYLKRKKAISEIFTNLSLLAVVSYLFKIYNIGYLEYVFPISTILLIFIEYFCKQLKNNTNYIYLLISFILSFLNLLSSNTLVGLIISIILVILFVYFIKNYQKNKELLFIPFIFLEIIFCCYKILIINGFNYIYICSIVFLILILYLSYKDKSSKLYLPLYYTNSFIHIVALEEYKYVGISLLIIGSLIFYFTNYKNNFIKFLIYTFSLILCKFIIYDLDLNYYVSINIGIYLIYILLITRNTIVNKSDLSKSLEYISTIVINIMAYFSYSNEVDGLIYVFALALFVFICYSRKYGPMFIINLLFIILNLIRLTKDFWLSIPWWIYILLVGSILIGFAVYNELKDNNGKENNKVLFNKFNKIKNDLDL